jgi:uncharacterized protein YeaO (DUF488 family)
VHPDIRVRRAYDPPVPEDGTRVLVDRVWPRGLRKDAARLDDWAKDVAPSSELRTWYGHDPAKFGEFRRRYTAELAQPGPQAALGRLRALAAKGPVTLLTATRDIDISQAAVLAQLLQRRK